MVTTVVKSCAIEDCTHNDRDGNCCVEAIEIGKDPVSRYTGCITFSVDYAWRRQQLHEKIEKEVRVR